MIIKLRRNIQDQFLRRSIIWGLVAPMVMSIFWYKIEWSSPGLFLPIMIASLVIPLILHKMKSSKVVESIEIDRDSQITLTLRNGKYSRLVSIDKHAILDELTLRSEKWSHILQMDWFNDDDINIILKVAQENGMYRSGS